MAGRRGGAAVQQSNDVGGEREPRVQCGQLLRVPRLHLVAVRHVGHDAAMHRRASSSILPVLLLLAACATPRVCLDVQGDKVVVTADGQPFAEVHFDAQPRPFVWPLHAAGSVPVTRDFPMAEREGEERDHPHHQSLWLAHGNVDGFDFWHGHGHRERQELADFTAVQSPTQAAVSAEYVWRVDDDRDVLRERRVLEFAVDGELRLVDVTATFTPAGQAPVRFGDTKEGTFAMRVHPALRGEGKLATGVLRNSEGQRGSAAWGKRARWLDDTGNVDGQRVGVTMFDHPDNLQHPTWWHARMYGLLAANPFGAKDFEKAEAGAGDFVLEPGQTLRLRYRVVLHRGDLDDAAIEALWQRWISG